MNNYNKLEIFRDGWEGKDTVCGWSSTMQNTINIRWFIKDLIQRYSIKSINDLGCGDLFWIESVLTPDFDYVGYDYHRRASWDRLENVGWKLEQADITKDNLRKADLTICRDVMIHLPNNMVLDFIDNVRKSGTNFLLTTNYVNPEYEEDFPNYSFSNFDRRTCPYIHHMKLDLRLPPFNLGNPITMTPENYPYKNISLWRINNEL